MTFNRRPGARNNRGRIAVSAGTSAPVPVAPPGAPELYLDARLGVAASGIVVTQWSDQSVNGRNYAHASLGPDFQAAGGPGGKSALYYSGASFAAARRLTGPSFAALAGGADVFILSKRDNAAASDAGQGGLWRYGSAGSANHVPFADGNVYDSFGSTTRQSAGSAGAHTAWSLLNLISVAGEWTGRMNRVQFYTTAVNTVGWNGASSTIGCDPTGGSTWLIGHIACVLMYAGKLSGGDRTAVENWFLSEWGV